jgi:hypothetical protein
LIAVKIPDVINAIISGTPFTTYFRHIADEQFAVTGGYLNKIYNTYYLTGGQRFDGRYNPMNNPTFTQEYTNSIRKFQIADDGTNLTITHLAAITDTLNLHRRDYNVAPQIMPDGQEGLTAFSGVFQVDADLPFLNCVNIDSTGHFVNNAFSNTTTITIVQISRYTAPRRMKCTMCFLAGLPNITTVPASWFRTRMCHLSKPSPG